MDELWRFFILLLVDEYDDSPLFYLWTSMTIDDSPLSYMSSSHESRTNCNSGGIYLRTYRNSGGMNLHPNSGGIILHPNSVPTVPCIVHISASIFIQYTSRYQIRYISPLWFKHLADPSLPVAAVMTLSVESWTHRSVVTYLASVSG